MSKRKGEKKDEGEISPGQRPRKKREGDVIIGTSGEGARHNAIGKNIIQIVIQSHPFTVIFLLLLVTIAFVAYYSIQHPSPKEMSNNFNIAIADFGEVRDSTEVAYASDDGQWLADFVFTRFKTRLNDVPELARDVELQHEYIDYIPGESPKARRLAAAELASKINADVVIYGYIDSQQAEFVPEFYISPQLTGADEITGESTFGSAVSVSVHLRENPASRRLLEKEVIPRFEALTEFMFGLGYFQAANSYDPLRNLDKALKHLERARNVRAWKDGDGKEILYLWIGSTLNKRALIGGETGDISCPVTSGEQLNYRDCARAAYEKALKLNHKFARAHIGLGNFWFDLAPQTRNGESGFHCNMYGRAIAEYQQAIYLAKEKEAWETAYVDLKAYYNSGLAYASLYQNCGDQSAYRPAVTKLKVAIEIYEHGPKVSLTSRIGTKAYYHLGLVYNQATHYELALKAFTPVITIAEPDQTHYEGKYDDIGIASEAYYGAGKAYEALGDMVRARDAYAQAKKLQALGGP